MCAAPARVAGVAEVVLFVPPAPDGRVDDATLTAARIAGIDEVYRVGGAQAIAAMAYGTETIAPVDVVVGPGNLYVAEAKRQVAGSVGIASAFAGPSEVVVIADDSTPPSWPPSISWSRPSTGPTACRGSSPGRPRRPTRWRRPSRLSLSARRAGATSSRRSPTGGYCCVVDDSADALEVANVVAPEHSSCSSMAPSPTSMRCGAPERVLRVASRPASAITWPAPTTSCPRIARPGSLALRADDFRRHIHAVTVTPEALDALGHHVIALAEAEGLVAHADSIRLRR